MDHHRKAVGDRLRDLRKANGLSQEHAARKVGVGVKTWNNWENGRTALRDTNARRIADAFGVSIATIIGSTPIEGDLTERLANLEAGQAHLSRQLTQIADAVAALAVGIEQLRRAQPEPKTQGRRRPGAADAH